MVNGDFKSRVVLGKMERPGMVGFLVRTGLAKDDKSAGIILISIVIVAVVFSYILIAKPFEEKNVLYREDVNDLTVPPILPKDAKEEYINSLPSRY